jgi:hypothetical protein
MKISSSKRLTTQIFDGNLCLIKVLLPKIHVLEELPRLEEEARKVREVPGYTLNYVNLDQALGSARRDAEKITEGTSDLNVKWRRYFTRSGG